MFSFEVICFRLFVNDNMLRGMNVVIYPVALSVFPYLPVHVADFTGKLPHPLVN